MLSGRRCSRAWPSAAVREALAAGAVDPLQGAFDAGGLRPSIEATLHALMPHEVVLHTQFAQRCAAAACLDDARDRLRARLDGPELGTGGVRPSWYAAGAAVRRTLAGSGGAAVHRAAETTEWWWERLQPACAHELLEDVCRRLAMPARALDAAPDLNALERLARQHDLRLPGGTSKFMAWRFIRRMSRWHERWYPLSRSRRVPRAHKVGVLPADAALPARRAGGRTVQLWLVPGKGGAARAGASGCRIGHGALSG
jgi:hypothetical protein